MLDVDLKARNVSTEEFSHTLGIRLQLNVHTSQVYFGFSQFSVIAPWRDRSCDLALIFGTFIHGIENYEAMRNDKELPFGRRISQFIIDDSGSAQAFRYFIVATSPARKVFDDALSSAKCKAKAESHETVAAVVDASKLVADQGSMINQGYTKKDSKTNPTCNTDKPQPFQNPNVIENNSQSLKEPNNFSQ